METLGPHMGIEGGQKSPKKLPKNMEREKMKKKELNLQKIYVRWLFGEIIHQIRGYGPYGDLGPP